MVGAESWSIRRSSAVREQRSLYSLGAPATMRFRRRNDGTTALILVRSLAANYPTTIARPRVFRLTPKVIFFSIARTGFDHMDLVMLEAHREPTKRSAASQEAT